MSQPIYGNPKACKEIQEQSEMETTQSKVEPDYFKMRLIWIDDQYCCGLAGKAATSFLEMMHKKKKKKKKPPFEVYTET